MDDPQVLRGSEVRVPRVPGFQFQGFQGFQGFSRFEESVTIVGCVAM